MSFIRGEIDVVAKQPRGDRATLPLDALFERAGETASAEPLQTLRELCVGALQRLAVDARTQVVFDVIFHKTEMVDELADMATSNETERCRCLSQIEVIIRRCAETGDLPPDTDPVLAAHARYRGWPEISLR